MFDEKGRQHFSLQPAHLGPDIPSAPRATGSTPEVGTSRRDISVTGPRRAKKSSLPGFLRRSHIGPEPVRPFRQFSFLLKFLSRPELDPDLCCCAKK